MPKTRHCEECQYREWVDSGLKCNKGHKPRFYKPQDNPYFTDWGWKRRCEDYEIGDHVYVMDVSLV